MTLRLLPALEIAARLTARVVAKLEPRMTPSTMKNMRTTASDMPATSKVHSFIASPFSRPTIRASMSQVPLEQPVRRSFDHLVGPGQQRRRDRQTNGPRGPKVQDETELRRLLER